MTRRISFELSAFEDFNAWAKLDNGYWSRRINDEHRLIYKITDTEIIIVACKYHYD